jgi:hypothetical protein
VQEEARQGWGRGCLGSCGSLRVAHGYQAPPCFLPRAAARRARREAEDRAATAEAQAHAAAEAARADCARAARAAKAEAREASAAVEARMREYMERFREQVRAGAVRW